VAPEALQPEGVPVEPVRAPSARRSTGRWNRARSEAAQSTTRRRQEDIRLALYSALSDRRLDGARRGRRQLRQVGTPKTKDAITALGALGLDGKILVVLAATTRRRCARFRNLMNVKTIDKGEVNATTSSTVTGFSSRRDVAESQGEQLMRDAMRRLFAPLVSRRPRLDG